MIKVKERLVLVYFMSLANTMLKLVYLVKIFLDIDLNQSSCMLANKELLRLV